MTLSPARDLSSCEAALCSAGSSVRVQRMSSRNSIVRFFRWWLPSKSCHNTTYSNPPDNHKRYDVNSQKVRADLVDDPCEGGESGGVRGDGDAHPGAVLHAEPQHPRHGVLHLPQSVCGLELETNLREVRRQPNFIRAT